MDGNEAAEVEDFRKRKDEFYRTDPESPLDLEQRAHFTGLKYFPYDPRYKVKAVFVPYLNPELISMETSKGIKQKYQRLGYFEFSIEGKTVRLQAYRSPHGTHAEGYFVPFRDKTSGKESYEKARYLNFDKGSRVGENEFMLDFNMAYNPYCAYTDKYMCPFPPAENVFDIPIKAGEKKAGF